MTKVLMKNTGTGSRIKEQELNESARSSYASRFVSPVDGQLERFTDKSGLFEYLDSTNFTTPGLAGWYKVGVGLYDSFVRANSTTTAGVADSGQNYINQVGTFGINGNQLYSASDTDGSTVLVESGTANPTMQGIINGGWSGANTRQPRLLFRALDSSNFLWVDFAGGTQVRLVKNDAGTATQLATASGAFGNASDYVVEVVCRGLSITVYVNATSYFTHTLVSANEKYMGYTKIGAQLSKAGSPIFSARWYGFIVRQAA